ncbi:MAG: GerAB/ArcD/ProY family transporter, partial [Syntrophomonadaceae bacterium]
DLLVTIAIYRSKGRHYMNKITNFQMYCIFLVFMGPVAVLEQPHVVIHILANNSWLALIASLFPGLLLIAMYSYIIKKSSQPFPILLWEHFGAIPGKILGFYYILVYMLVAAFTLRLFIEFMKMNVLPATPISVFIGVLLFVGFIAIKLGLEHLARVSELVSFAGVTLAILVIIIAIAGNFHPERLKPFFHMDYKTFTLGVLASTALLGKFAPVLMLGFFLPDKNRSYTIMKYLLYTYTFIITLTTTGILITRGVLPSFNLTFPTFSMIRLARIGTFIQNIDILFIGIVILGVFAAVAFPWLLACFTTQKVLGLDDYRFLAAPSSLILGILAILIGSNDLAVVIWSRTIMPAVYTVSFIFIPLLLFIVTLFKPVPDEAGSDRQSGASNNPDISS